MNILTLHARKARRSGTEHQSQFGNFDLVKRIKLDYTDVSLSQWRSRKTGLTMLHLDYEGLYDPFRASSSADLLIVSSAPIVKGYFVVASESMLLF